MKLVSRVLPVGMALALSFGVSACGSSESASSPGGSASNVVQDPAVDEAARALLPAQYQNSINVAMDIPYEPMEYLDADGKLVGVDVDIANAIAGKLGVTMDYQDQPFDTVIPSLQAKKHDIIVSSMQVTAQKLEAVDTISYFRQGAMIVVRKGNPQAIGGMKDLCGKSVAIQKGSAFIDKVNTFSTANCGANPVVIVQYANSTDSQTAVRSDRVVALVTNAVPARQIAKTAGDGAYFETVTSSEDPQGYQPAPLGIGVLKTNTDLRDAIRTALQSLIDDGTYGKILEKWSLSEFGVEQADINSTR